MKARFFLFADDGYPPYGTTIVTTRTMVANKPELVARFVKASIAGWKSYLANPAPAPCESSRWTARWITSFWSSAPGPKMDRAD